MIEVDAQFAADYARVLGTIVRRHRAARRWTRTELVEALRALPAPWTLELPPSTLVTYELGTRSLSVLRLAQIELALGVPPGTIDAEVKAVMWPSADPNRIVVDLRALSQSARGDIGPVIRWATSVLAESPELTMAELTLDAVAGLATLCLLDTDSVMAVLAEFRAVRRYEGYGKQRVPKQS
ncbi:MAG TPA: helix-turn-helix transcriptional regulator [Pseudonocardiaceae bacterium]|nr:helix-turn-helix transcriptional regulator [Pseudonocardiaceae bacterium]